MSDDASVFMSMYKIKPTVKENLSTYTHTHTHTQQSNNATFDHFIDPIVKCDIGVNKRDAIANHVSNACACDAAKGLR